MGFYLSPPPPRNICYPNSNHLFLQGTRRDMGFLLDSFRMRFSTIAKLHLCNFKYNYLPWTFFFGRHGATTKGKLVSTADTDSNYLRNIGGHAMRFICPSYHRSPKIVCSIPTILLAICVSCTEVVSLRDHG